MSDDEPDYDPMRAPDPKWWLSLDEDDRNSLVLEYHRLARIKLPNNLVHAAFHSIVETPAAMGDELPVARTLKRLEAEGLDRHDALHAIGSVLAERVYGLMGSGAKSGADTNQAYSAELERLSARSWRAR